MNAPHTTTTKKTVASHHKRATLTHKVTPKPTPLPAEVLWHKAREVVDVIEAPKRHAIMVSGTGSPDASSFPETIEALYGLAFTLKLARKTAGHDFKVPPIEAVWSAPERMTSFVDLSLENARWKLRLDVPLDVGGFDIDDARRALVAKHGETRAINEAVIESIAPMRMWRILHVGPYADERRSFEALFAAMKTAGAKPGRFHHEIYVNDPRRTKPERLKTILLLEEEG